MGESKIDPARLQAMARSDSRADAAALIAAFRLDDSQKQRLQAVLGDPEKLQTLLQSARAKQLAQQMAAEREPRS